MMEEGFADEFERAALMADAVGALTRRRIKALNLRESTRDEAVSVVAASGFRYMDETRLWHEWRNDRLATRTGDERLVSAMRDPDDDYAAWLSARVRDPYRVSARAKERAVGLVGFEKSNMLVMVTWQQEIAWAQRMRTSRDDVTSVISALFLSMAERDPSVEFLKMAEAWKEVVDDREYAMASAHHYEADAIRSGHGDDSFGPIFLRRGRIVFADRLDRMDATAMRAAAERGRRAEAEETSARANRRAADAVLRTPMFRISGVIQVAIEAGMDSDALVDAQERFVGQLVDRKVAVPDDGGLPYREFVAWLRTARHAKTDGVRSPLEEIGGQSDLLAMVASPKRWIESLPADYLAMGAGEVGNFHRWALPIVRLERQVPRDMVADYGFFLVKSTHRSLAR